MITIALGQQQKAKAPAIGSAFGLRPAMILNDHYDHSAA